MNKKISWQMHSANFGLMGLALIGSVLMSSTGLAQAAPELSRGNVTVNSDVLDALGPPAGQGGVYRAPALVEPGSKTKSGKLKSQFLGPATLGAAATTVAANDAPHSSFTPPPSAGSVNDAYRTPLGPQAAPAAAPVPAAAPAPAYTPPPTAPAATASAAPAPAPAAAAPAPKPAQAAPAAPAPKATQTANLPPARSPGVPPAVAANAATIAFATDSADLTDDAKQGLAGVIQKLNASPDARIKLSAYASGTPETVSQTRRLSLSRALTVRSYLIDQGVKSTRIDVLALGNQVQSGSADRVDLAVVAQ